MSYRNITMIGDLPELDDNPNMERGNSERMNQDVGIGERYQKFIRNTHPADRDSGMGSYGQRSGNYDINEGYTDGPPPMQQQMPPQQVIVNPAQDYSCVSIAKHIENCPICSRFYQTDKSIYIISIVILALISLMLLKKILNV